ncbi:MAG: non-ribosomal peptide synthetase [Xanthobacteraceae bacterium]
MSDVGARSDDGDSHLQLQPSDWFQPDRLSAAAVDGDLSRTIGARIRAHARLRPEQPAFVGTNFAPFSYGELQRLIDEFRLELRQAGLDHSARIAIDIANSSDAALSIVAVACCAAAVPLDPKLTGTEIDRCLTILRPAAVLTLRGSESVARRVAAQRGIPLIEARPAPGGNLGLRLDCPAIGDPAPLDEPPPDAPAFILHTSGTTAEPNLVPYSHRNVLASAERVQIWFGLTPQDRCLNVSPVFYSHALTTTVLPPLLAGGSTAFPSNPLSVDLSEWLGALRPTWYSAGPTLHLAVLEKVQQLAQAPGLHCLRFVSSAGARIPRHIHEALQSALGVPVLEHYGSSETAQIASNMPPPGPCKPGTCGIPWPDIMKIVDEDDGLAPLGERGEILVRGPSVMLGYLNAPELNRLVFVDGWYRTGDIGSLDEQGFLSLHGRKRELINRGAEKIAPLEIDQALMRHSGILEAAAYGVPHPRLGEDVAAAVVLRSGAKVTVAELREFLSGHLATFKIPRRISFVEKLPKGITGKVQRMRLDVSVSAPAAPVDAPSRAPLVRLWDRLKQLIAPSCQQQAEAAPAARNGGAVDDPQVREARLQGELLQIWKRLLKVETLDLDDDFFASGGNSLLAMDVHVQIQRLTGRSLPASLLSKAPTVRALAKLLSS